MHFGSAVQAPSTVFGTINKAPGQLECVWGLSRVCLGCVSVTSCHMSSATCHGHSGHRALKPFNALPTTEVAANISCAYSIP